MDNFEKYTDTAVGLMMAYLPKLLLAIVTLVVGLWIIKLVVRGLDRAMQQSNTDLALRKFFLSVSGIALKVLLVISVLTMIGIETTSFIAVLGAAGLAIGLALQGGLQNFAGGVLILIFKPFKIGDFLEAQGYKGKVHEIQIFNTIMKTPDNKTVIIPNGALSGGSMVNYSTEATRRVDMTFGIGYDDDIPKAKAVLKRLVDEDSRILKDPAPQIVLAELADSSVNFYTRVWCNTADYWDIFFDMHENVKLTFDAENISIPFPQRDVHLHQVTG